MMESKLTEYKFQSIYKFLSIVYMNVEAGVDFWNFNGDSFVKSALKFNKKSLLHIYVTNTLYCYYNKEFRRNGDLIEEDDIEWWTNLMKIYKVKLKHKKYDEEKDGFVWEWYIKNEEQFIEFFDAISEEVVHILFNDKNFLFLFNRLVRNVLIDEDGTYADYVKWPENSRNEDGTIKRCPIPQWVKHAVYHRDKGHCVFCNRDLTDLVTTLNSKNYDHIVPLKDYGTNDPCNLQLTCEHCNKSKGAKDKVPNYKYQKWW
jgi:hypothetical protein